MKITAVPSFKALFKVTDINPEQKGLMGKLQALQPENSMEFFPDEECQQLFIFTGEQVKDKNAQQKLDKIFYSRLCENNYNARVKHIDPYNVLNLYRGVFGS